MSTLTPNLGLIKPELTDAADITAMNANWDKIDEALKGMSTNEIVQATLVSTGWTGDSAPYTYTLTSYDDKTVEVVEDVSMTLEQLEVIENAKIKSDPSSNENILYAFGDKPEIDVPVLLIVR